VAWGDGVAPPKPAAERTPPRGSQSRARRLESAHPYESASPVTLGSPLAVSFGLIFLAELGDKTLYTVLLLATRNRALPVLLGAWAAFVVQELIALFMGSLLARLSATLVYGITAAVFLGFGLYLLLKNEPEEEVDTLERPSSRVLLLAFGMVFAAEWGDATQIGSAALVATMHAPLQVFVGATLGLWAGAALAVTIGRTVRNRVRQRVLRACAGVLFCVFGALVIVHMLRP